MWKLIRTFFSTDLGKSILVGGAAIALFYGTYVAGKATGEQIGHKAGFTAGRSSRNEEVADLKEKVKELADLINNERDATGRIVKQLEKDAAEAFIRGQVDQATRAKKRDDIVAGYKASNPAASNPQACGLDLPTVKTINELLTTQGISAPTN